MKCYFGIAVAAMLGAAPSIPVLAQLSDNGFPYVGSTPPAREQPPLTADERSKLKDELAKAREGAKAATAKSQKR
ncbi:hypothetical protein [Bradyrhizobium erythrophlei]|uniref:Uncharacterized protein n=1 Tax=Bradyrhizobium erythrophlei TaxID=1437360 RepID=A0A1M7UHR7_9BRAD|nr:hypothetical protein [Bradyrhizobium erythrophlei]SHN82484.1 hypothetical protein SAMN05444170_5126 [Bradyrhizobium erythrophlei]